MITAAYCRTMARYNAWQNDGLRAAFRELPLAVLEEERDAFFGSIFGTANHLLWGDAMWMSRFDGWDKPEIGI
ncbi:MAG: DinB family protein, partial [Planctomycetota bacterium]